MRNLYWLVLIPLFFLSSLQAAELSINAYVDKTTIGLDDVLSLTVEISGKDAGDAGQPELPVIRNFDNIGTSTSSSSSFSIVNGRMTSSITKRSVHTLKPQETGSFIIPPISIQYDNETLVTNPIRITVVEGTAEPPPVSQQFRDPAAGQDQITDNIFLVADLSKTSVMRGEPIIVNYLLYSRYDLANLSYVNEPNFTGFWKDDIFFANRMNFQRTNYQGRVFNVMKLRTVVLYPNQTGDLIVPPLEITPEIIVRPRTFFDFDSTRRVNVASKPVSVNVRELPVEERPDNFTGAVGNYRIQSEINASDLTVGDTFTFILRINGTGNLKHFAAPPFPAIPSIRTLDPEVTTDTRIEQNKVMGNKTISYPVIVQEDGELNIPPLTFGFYDPAANRYRTIETIPYNISAAPSVVQTIPLRVAQQDILPAGADISYIHRTATMNNPGLLAQSLIYWLLWILFLFTIPFACYYRIEQKKLASDINYVRQKQAHKILRKYLDSATQAAKKGNMNFYSYVNTGLSNYLTDNLEIPRGSTTDDIIEEMRHKRYSPDIVNRVKNIISKCLEARFAPGGFNQESIKKDYEDIKDIVTLLSRQKRNGKIGRIS